MELRMVSNDSLLLVFAWISGCCDSGTVGMTNLYASLLRLQIISVKLLAEPDRKISSNHSIQRRPSKPASWRPGDWL